MTHSGRFVSLDGPDGGGKTTHCRLLADWLQKQQRHVTVCRDPGGTALGEEIRNLLLHREWKISLACEALLYMASRAQLVDEVIRPALTRGDVVLSDRFVLANVVYQGYGGGLPVDRLWDIGRLATGGLLPDLTLVLDVPPEVGASRRLGQADRIESRDPDFHARVRAGFLEEAKRRPETIRVIDAAAPIPVVQEAIRREVARVLG